MTAEPNPKQTLILWALLGQGGAAAQGTLGFKIDKKDRDALQKAGLLGVNKGKRGAVDLEVTDQGWDWAGEHLDAALPSGRSATKAGTPVLQAWLGRLHAYLRSSNVALAEVLAPAAAATEGGAAPGPVPVPEPRHPTPGYAELRERLRRTYRTLTGGQFNDSVTLSRLRKALPDLDAATFDRTVLRMHNEDDGTTLMNLGNPREIEPERDFAIRVKGQDMHVLWITR